MLETTAQFMKLNDCKIWIIVGLFCSGEYRISSSIKCINCDMKEAKSDGMKGSGQAGTEFFKVSIIS